DENQEVGSPSMGFSSPGGSVSSIDFVGSTFEAPARTAPVQLPPYLVEHYDWAYLWPISVWFFDHQPIINAILFGNYRRIMENTLRMMDPQTAGRTLQVAGVYGELTPTLMSRGIEGFSLIDAAPIQLEAARKKLA